MVILALVIFGFVVAPAVSTTAVADPGDRAKKLTWDNVRAVNGVVTCVGWEEPPINWADKCT